MAKILRLDLKGFKSFANLTTLNFSSGFNVIIGPNGSGKSNIFDALCFVLGKSSMKDIRAERAANLIYNGGKSKKAAKQAEVSIYFDNRDHSFPLETEVVKLTRIVNQDGKSTYKINDKTRTRREVVELLNQAHINPDGYNIVLQGDITKIVEMTPIERRLIIEEIAGIRIYEEKKQKALNELQKVEETLKEADLILSERQERLEELEKEREMALRYLDLQKQIKTYQASIIRKELLSLEKKLSSVNEKLNALNNELEKYNDKIKKLQQEKREYLEKIDEITKEIEEKSNFGESEIKKQLDELKIQYEKKKLQLENYEKEYEQLILKKVQLEKALQEAESKVLLSKKEIEELENKKQELEEMIDQTKSKIAELKKRYNFDDLSDLEKELEEVDTNIEKLNQKADELKKKQSELIRQKDRYEFELNNLRSRLEELKKQQQEIEKQKKELKKLKDEFKKVSLELNSKLDLDTKYSKELAHAREKYIQAENEITRLRSKLDQKAYANASERILKVIRDLKKSIPGIYGTVSELAAVDEKYALALEIAAGTRINGVVVENEDVAIQIIKHLKSNKLGTAIFFPLNKIKPPREENLNKYKKISGVVGTALELLDFDPKFSNVFKYVFSNTLIIENVDVAKAVGVGKVRMVTLDGDLFETSGAIQGGFRQKKTSGFSDKALRDKINKLENELQNYDVVIKELEEKKKQNLNEIYELRKKKAELEAEIIKIEKLSSQNVEVLDDKELKQKLAELEKQLDVINDDLMEVMQKISQEKIKKQRIREAIAKAKSPEVVAELNAYEDQLKNYEQEMIKVNEKLNHSRDYLKNVLIREMDETKSVLNDTVKQIKKLEQLKTELNQELLELDDQIQELKEKEQEIYSEFKELFNKRNQYESLLREIEQKIMEFEESIRETERKINLINLNNADSKARYEALKEQLKEFDVDEYVDASMNELKSTLNKLKKEFSEMQEVNLKSIQDYEEMKKKIDEIIKKKEELEKEKAEVLVLMNEIETKKKEAFMNTFNKINESFKRIFKELMPKGEATLQLEDPKEIFNAGMKIVVRLTTKRFIDIRSLSGGEKSMTALAFIFSIQEYQPAPFYIFDEVDAALDKRNTEKLADYIKRYSKKAQYVVVSHNDTLIVEADTIFGVSMNKDGVSSVVALKLEGQKVDENLKREVKKRVEKEKK